MAKKAILSKTGPEKVEHSVKFQTWRFDSLVYDKGYDVFLDKAYKCPCRVKNSNNPLPDCKNCLGMGWLFANRIETKMVLQSINADIKYENWTQTTSGTAKITARAKDKLAFMDRITLKNVEGYFNEVVRMREMKNDSGQQEYFLFTNYEIKDIEEVMAFKSSNENLLYLKENEDFEVDKDNRTKIKILKPELKNSNLSVTIRYRHDLAYHIIEMNRDIRKVEERSLNCDEKEDGRMPISGIARKIHLMFDNVKFEEARELLDNTKE